MRFVPIIYSCALVYFILTILTLIFFCHIFGIYHTRGKEFRKYWPTLFEFKDNGVSDELYKEGFLVYGLNDVRKKIAKGGLTSPVLYFPQA